MVTEFTQILIGDVLQALANGRRSTAGVAHELGLTLDEAFDAMTTLCFRGIVTYESGEWYAVH